MAPHSLPHEDPTEALNLLLRTMPMLVTWPHLPKRSFLEAIHIQSASGFPGLVIDEATGQVHVQQEATGQGLDRLALAYLQEHIAVGELSGDYAAALIELLHTPVAWFGGRAIGSYMMGPISLAMNLTDDQHRPLIATPSLVEALTQHLIMRVAWLSDKLTNLTDDSIIFLYEPFLDAFATSFVPIEWDYAIDVLQQVLASIQGCSGLVLTPAGNQHDDGFALDWSSLLDISVELLVLELAPDGTIPPPIAAIVPEFLQRSGAIAWGLVPADTEAHNREIPAALIARFERLVRELNSRGVPSETVLTSSFITTTTSLAHLSIDAAEQIIQRCTDVSAQVRRRYKLDQ